MRILNKRYWPTSVQLNYDYRREDDIILWCKENFGRQWFLVGSSTYYFRNEQDATLFRLKWAH